MDEEGKPNIITIAWSIPLSMSPPLVAISVGKTRYSHQLIKNTKEFVINIPSKGLAKQATICGSLSGRTVDKFKRSGLTPEPARCVKPPLIKECIAHLECQLVNEIETGDHTLFVGKVLAATAEENLFDVQWDVSRAKPLMHVSGRTYTAPAEPFTS